MCFYGGDALYRTSVMILILSSLTDFYTHFTAFIFLSPFQEQSAARSGVIDADLVGLDIHAVSELGNRGLSPTHDLPKFNYTANDKGEYG